MTDGTEVRIRARVDWFGRRGQVRLRMLSIDPAYTLGRLAEAREQLLRQLDAEGLIARQGALRLADVPLSVGLVTSAESAAAADFLHTLETSRRRWRVLLADARVQGQDASMSVTAALQSLFTHPDPPDVICLVRGGGSRTDLAPFDGALISRAIATSPIPVLTGIGHEIDQTVADVVAHRAYKTPTACATALVERVDAFVARGERAWERIGMASSRVLENAEAGMQRASGRAGGACGHHVRAALTELAAAEARVRERALRAPEVEVRSLDALQARIQSLDPARLLARGWSITRDEGGRLVTSGAHVQPGARLRTTLVDGEVLSRVE